MLIHRQNSFARGGLLLLLAASGGCSSAGLDGASGKSKANAAPANPAPPADEENIPSTQPTQVSGAFLTVDCGLTKDPVPGVAAGQDAVGCAIIDTHAKAKVTGKAITVSGLTFGFHDGTDEKAVLTVAPTTSAWHVYTTLPSGRLDDVVAIVVRGTVDQAVVTLATTTPRTYDLEHLTEAPPPAEADSLPINPADFPPLPTTAPPDLVIGAAGTGSATGAATATATEPATATASHTETATATATATAVSTDPSSSKIVVGPSFAAVSVTVLTTTPDLTGYTEADVFGSKPGGDPDMNFVGTGNIFKGGNGTGWDAGESTNDAKRLYVFADLMPAAGAVPAISRVVLTPGMDGRNCGTKYGIYVSDTLTTNDVDLVSPFQIEVYQAGNTKDGDVYTFDFAAAVQARYWKVAVLDDGCADTMWKHIGFYAK